MSINRKANYILEQAEILAGTVKTWADFSAALFDQKNGLVAQTFQSQMEREAFLDSEQYQRVRELLLGLMKKFGVREGATPEKSGRFVVRVPKTVHAALEIEARREGVSLNQLASSKLSVPLRERMDLSVPLIVEAFIRVYDGYSTDRVVVDPTLNAAFLAKCRSLGLRQSDYHLNHALMDIRKSKKAELPEATKRTQFTDYDEFMFAAEIAIRTLQRTEGVTLDQILCDPPLAMQFDTIAKRLAPEQSALKLRWAALNLRKTRRLGPSRKQQASVPDLDLVPAGPLVKLKPSDLVTFPAAYVFFDRNWPIFAGETDNLRRRIELHKRGGLPEWLDISGDLGFILKYSAAPTIKQEERIAWLQQFILKEKPLLNYQKAA
jgi:hypothetical protein